MWTMLKTSVLLFFQGRLFQDTTQVLRRLGAGIVLTAMLLVILSAVGVPLPVAAAVAAVAGGALQPYLFRDLKFR